jgi:uncharacterized membrane protein (DUF4010 family)
MNLEFLQALGLGVLLGLLVGVERERSARGIAGIRTFALITVLGVVCGELASRFGQWVLVSGFWPCSRCWLANIVLLRQQKGDPGITTEIAALLMFAVGAALSAGLRVPAAVTTGVVALLLHWKQPLHALVQQLGDADVKAIMRLALIGLVILPILPNRSYDPFGVINPFQIWLMVVLIVGISLIGYVAYRLFGARQGVLLSGVLGGLISSTAATVGYAKRSRSSSGSAFAVMILIASAVMFVRVLFEIGIVVPTHFASLGLPMTALFVLMVLVAAVAYRRADTAPAAPAETKPPTDLRAAIFFGLLYAAVLIAVAVARQQVGTHGLYLVAALSGLTDMDAITLSTAQLVRANQLPTSTGWRLIVIGAMANLVFKFLVVAFIADRRFTARIAAAFAAVIAGGAFLLVVLPH